MTNTVARHRQEGEQRNRFRSARTRRRRLVTPVAAARPILLVEVLVADRAEHAREHCAESVGEGAAADGAHVRPRPFRIVRLLADGNVAHGPQRGGHGGDGERDDEAGVESPARGGSTSGRRNSGAVPRRSSSTAGSTPNTAARTYPTTIPMRAQKSLVGPLSRCSARSWSPG